MHPHSYRSQSMRAWLALLEAFALAACLAHGAASIAAERLGDGGQELVPLTRDAMKAALDDSKQSVPRLPLPPLTEEEQALIKEQEAKAAQSGEKPRRFGLANNGRMRAFYLAEYGFERSRDVERARANTTQDAHWTLDPNLRTSIFWIVSRGNNCTYCLGHQEASLASRGMTDDELAALDGDWAEIDDSRRAAFTFARKLSFEPYAISDQDLDALRKHYNDAQVAEIVLAVAGFNATNRWTGPLRIKQDVLFQYTRPTAEKYAALVTRLLPVDESAARAGFAPPQARRRPPLESRSEVEAALSTARQRAPRLPLADEAATKALIGGGSDKPPAQWQRLLAATPKSGGDRLASYQAVLDKGTIEPRTKAIIAYVGARNDRAWYALGHAIARLREQGFTDDQIFALDQPEKLKSDVDRTLVLFARKITNDPALINDDDFARMRAIFSDKQVAEVVYVTTQAAFFDRLTEAAGLQLEAASTAGQ
jgi:alkylhydroperoxidase family enzyme